MKKKIQLILIIPIVLLLSNCTKGELIKGEYIYYDGAAVLQTDSIIYGVIINKKVEQLNTKANALKKEATDMVFVELMGNIIPKPENEEGWEYRIEVKDIVKVSPSNDQEKNVIELESN